MNTTDAESACYAGDISPVAAWQMLEEDAGVVLVDV